ncbi:MAG: outer membrane protein assembly factor BamD [Haliscomenobacteraceae bacterium CHB4]|nr:Outer membrane protein assembly factor BamD [Saprospiraceae bacterium]MCE7921845.1 outer membrane protein assembly factor BamD [Haliscomenobacteraceae bacterium CHB4]
MKITFGWLALSSLLFLFGACKSEYERIRTGGDPELILNKAFEYYEKEDYQKAQSLFELVLSNIKGTKKAEKANFCYSYTHYHLKEYLLAAFYFRNFANTFTNSEFREEAAFMSAYSNYKLSPTYRLDQTNTQKAIEEFQLFVNLFPKSPRVQECNNLIDEMRRKLEEKAFGEGELYFNLKQYQSAVISFDNLLRDYPESPDTERVRYLIARASFLLSENSVVEKKMDRYTETMTRCNDFLEKYPKSKYIKEIRDTQKKAEQAMKALRKRFKST